MDSDVGVSVIMPAYNASSTLGRSIASCLAQSHRKLELIIVDDGSTDSTAEIAERAAADDPRVRVIGTTNGGVAAARNRAIAAARFDLVAPLDADDLWHPTKLAKQVAKLTSAGAKTAFVYTHFRVVDEADRVIHSAPAYGPRGRVLCRHLLYNFVGNGSSPLLRRAAVEEAGGYDRSLQARGVHGCEDLLLQLRLAGRYAVEVVPEYLVGYRRVQSNMSSNTIRMTRSWAAVYDELRNEGWAVPPDAFVWGEAMFRVEQALLALRSAAIGDAVRLGVAAFRQDAAGSGGYFLARLGLAMTTWQRHRSDPARQASGSRRPFYDYAPHEDWNLWRPGWPVTYRQQALARVDAAITEGEP